MAKKRLIPQKLADTCKGCVCESGGQPYMVFADGSGKPIRRITCLKCWRIAEPSETIEGAIENWNKRKWIKETNNGK